MQVRAQGLLAASDGIGGLSKETTSFLEPSRTSTPVTIVQGAQKQQLHLLQVVDVLE